MFYLVAILHCFVGPVGWPHAFHHDCSSEWLYPMMPTVGVFTQHIPCLAPHSPREERAPDGDVYGKGIAAFKARPVLMKDVPTTPLATCALFTVRVCIYSQHCLPVYTWLSFSTAVNADWLSTMSFVRVSSVKLALWTVGEPHETQMAVLFLKLPFSGWLNGPKGRKSPCFAPCPNQDFPRVVSMAFHRAWKQRCVEHWQAQDSRPCVVMLYVAPAMPQS